MQQATQSDHDQLCPTHKSHRPEPPLSLEVNRNVTTLFHMCLLVHYTHLTSMSKINEPDQPVYMSANTQPACIIC